MRYMGSSYTNLIWINFPISYRVYLLDSPLWLKNMVFPVRIFPLNQCKEKNALSSWKNIVFPVKKSMVFFLKPIQLSNASNKATS